LNWSNSIPILRLFLTGNRSRTSSLFPSGDLSLPRI
jgi:hypothetical protein